MKIDSLFLSTDASYSEVLEITGTLELDPNKSITITTNKNIIVTGKLISKPVLPNVHTIRFVGIDESKFVGGGMDVLDSDTGLWVMGKGQLDIDAPERMGWTRTVFDIKAGDTMFAVEDPEGWQVGDEIVIMPTAPNAQNYDERKITKIVDNIISVDKALTDHPTIPGFPSAEVANLTRNVRIEGTATGRTHIFIHASAVQNITAAAMRYMGPRKTQQGVANSLVSGRYGLHFHHAEDGSRGSLIDCCVIRDCGNHSFVPHGSHGITFDQCVSYNTLEDAYWYDLGHSTHDLLYKDCLAARIGYVPRALDMDLWAIDTSDKVPSLGANGWLLGRGDMDKIKGCVVVGSSGDPHAKGGFLWPTRDENSPEGVWDFSDNLAHNCNCGLVVWQNTQLNHTNRNYKGYSNGIDGFHGAYQNNYIYEGGKCNGPFEVKVASADRLRFINYEFGTVNLLGSALDSQFPMLFLNCKWKNWVDAVGESVHGADIVNCEGPISVTGLATEVVRVQPKSGQAYRLTKSGKTLIPNFAPTIWGTGTGLKGEYFNDSDFKNKVFERVDAVISFGDWGNLVHHLITSTKFSVQWSGKIQPQFTEAYTFIAVGGGEIQIFIAGKLVTGKINLVAGQFYDILIKFRNNDDNVRGGASVLWNSPSINVFSPGGEFLHQLQLYPSAIVPPPPVNKPPVANAGPDISIQLPLNSVVLSGSGSDADGVITAYKWTGKGTMIDSDKSMCVLRDLLEGDYVYTLTVTDDKGATGTDTVTVYVLPAPPPPVDQPPVVSLSATADVIKTATFHLNGKASDPEGKALTYQWRQESGNKVTITDADKLNATVFGATEGPAYKFVLKVTDAGGNVVEQAVFPTF